MNVDQISEPQPDDLDNDLAERLCPHRGLGPENTLTAISAGIACRPLFVEFDIQWHTGALRLGHPPVVNMDQTLLHALALFKGRDTFPKIDLKSHMLTYALALGALRAELSEQSLPRWLVNIGGALGPQEYMEAESKFVEQTDERTLLNIDLERYGMSSLSTVSRHVTGLVRTPFSISPNLESNVANAMKFAQDHGIGHIHFWSHPGRRYTSDHLKRLIDISTEYGLESYFDIASDSIISA